MNEAIAKALIVVDFQHQIMPAAVQDEPVAKRQKVVANGDQKPKRQAQRSRIFAPFRVCKESQDP